MTRNLSQPSTLGRVAANRFNTKDTRQKPHAFRWWQPDCIYCLDLDDDKNCAEICTGDEPPLVNNWEQPSPPLERFAFRLHADGSLEFKGHLDSSGGASSGTVAFTLPGANAGEVNFRLPRDQFYQTIITTDDGSTFMLAMVFIDATTGDVTITWPALT